MISPRLVQTAQFFFGGWFLFHGLNYFFDFFPQPGGGGGAGLIPALIQSGLFAWIKIVEIIVGVMLLANRFVPLAIVVAVPITVVIAYLNLVMKADAKGFIVGAAIIALHGIMALGYLEYYHPMLAARSGNPMRLPVHVIAITLGVAAPVALTYASLI